MDPVTIGVLIAGAATKVYGAVKEGQAQDTTAALNVQALGEKAREFDTTTQFERDQADRAAARRAALIARQQPFVDRGSAAYTRLADLQGLPSGPAPWSGPLSGAPRTPSGETPGWTPTAPNPFTPDPTGWTPGKPSGIPRPGYTGMRDEHGRVMYVPQSEATMWKFRGFQPV